MAQQTINVGAAPNDGTGDPDRTAWTKANANFTELYARGGGAVAAPQGRLTLQSATPVMTTTQSAKTTIYYTPYVGNMVPLYDGTTFTMTVIAAAFGEISAVTTDTTKSPAAIGANKVNDWFVWLDGSTVRLGHGPDWTNDTTRSGGTALVNNGGIMVNGSPITNGPGAQRGTYVGTTRSNASSQLDFIFASSAAGGGAGFVGVWNVYNRVDIGMLMLDSTASWTWATLATWRAANASNTARISFVIGLNEDSLDATYNISSQPVASASAIIAIGLDSSTVPNGVYQQNSNTGQGPVTAKYIGNPGIGFHYLQAIEYANNGTAGFYSNIAPVIRSGLHLLMRA